MTPKRKEIATNLAARQIWRSDQPAGADPRPAAAAGERRGAEANARRRSRSKPMSTAKSLQAQDAPRTRASSSWTTCNISESIARTAGERATCSCKSSTSNIEEKERTFNICSRSTSCWATPKTRPRSSRTQHLPKEKARAQDQAPRDNQTPFEAYRDSLPKNMGEAGEAMQTTSSTA
jgi:transcription elongation factor